MTHPRPRGKDRREDDDGRDQETTDPGPGPAAVVRPPAPEAVRPILGIRARCPGGAPCRPWGEVIAALTATRRRPEGHGAAPGPELAPLARGLSRTRARAGVDPGGTTPALEWPATAS